MLLTSKEGKLKSGKECFMNFYKCDWCGLEWEQITRKGYGENKEGTPHSKPVSTQIQCARCKNFIPSWS